MIAAGERPALREACAASSARPSSRPTRASRRTRLRIAEPRRAGCPARAAHRDAGRHRRPGTTRLTRGRRAGLAGQRRGGHLASPRPRQLAIDRDPPALAVRDLAAGAAALGSTASASEHRSRRRRCWASTPPRSSREAGYARRGDRRPRRSRRQSASPKPSNRLLLGAVDAAGELAAEQRFEPLRHRDQRVEVDAGLDSLAVEEVEHVLGGDVPGRARRERAAAEAADRGVEDGGSGLDRRPRARDAGVARVVEVAADRDAEDARRVRAAGGPAPASRRRSCPRGRPRRRRRRRAGRRGRRRRPDRRRPRRDSRTRR